MIYKYDAVLEVQLPWVTSTVIISQNAVTIQTWKNVLIKQHSGEKEKPYLLY